MKKLNLFVVLGLLTLSLPAFAENIAQNSNSDLNSLEKRIADLEEKLAKSNVKTSSPNSSRNIYSNAFNPSIGIILNGQYSAFSKTDSSIKGFGIGEEGERGKDNFSLGESELNFSSNIDDKFFGSLTAAIVNEDGSDAIELEESFIQTTPGLGLPTGLSLKAGRALWNFGYLNDHHAHTDDFADRPLPYRVFLNSAFNDDGAQISYVLPTLFYSEIGGGTFSGGDFPLNSGSGKDSYSAYARVGGDIGDNQNWRFGLSVLSGDAKAGRKSNEDLVEFIGKTDLYAADLRYTFAPTGNPKNQELTLQGEYFLRSEKGTYEDSDFGSGVVDFNGNSSGFYLQSVYKFKPNWRAGLRFSQLDSPNVPNGLIGSALDSSGFNPKTITAMVDWSNSEFSRIRLQVGQEKFEKGKNDNQVILQYVMSIGAHGAHSY